MRYGPAQSQRRVMAAVDQRAVHPFDGASLSSPEAVSASGGQEQLSGLFTAQRLTLVRLAYLLTGDLETAQDVVQDVFTGFWQRSQASRIENSAGYLWTSVVNKSRSATRRRRLAELKIPFLRADQDHAPSAEAFFLHTEENRSLAQAVKALPRRQREVVVLRYWGGLSEAEIATTLGVSKGTVKSSASRALTSLHTALADRSS